MQLDDHLKNLLRELGHAITDTVSDSDRITGAICGKQKKAYDIVLKLDATIGLAKRDAAAADESDADLFASAVAGTAAQLEDAWKQANILDYRHTATITVRVPTGTLERFVDVRDRLAQVPAIQRSELVSLDREEARVEIRYFGDRAQFRTALAQRDLVLEGDAPDWVLERRAAAAQR